MLRLPKLALAVVALAVTALPAGLALAADPTLRAETGAAVVSGSSRATLNGAVVPVGGATYHFDYGTSASYGSRTGSVDLPAGTSRVAVRAVVSGLEPGATYHYRLVARSGERVSNGRDRTFVVGGSAGAPQVSTLPSTSPGTDRLTLSARVNPGGRDTGVRFEWGTTKAYGAASETVDAGSGTSARTVSTVIDGLKAGTVYHFRAVATNAVSTVRGGDRSVRTSRGLTGISLLAPDTLVPWDGSVRMTGAVAGRAVNRVEVVLLRQDFPYSAPYRRVSALKTSSTGTYAFRVQRVYSSARVKVQVEGLASPVVNLSSQLFVRLRGQRRGQNSVRLYGRVFPARKNGRARIERLQPNGTWKRVRTVRLQRLKSGRSTFRATVQRISRKTAYRAVVDPRDGGAHVVTVSGRVAVAARR